MSWVHIDQYLRDRGDTREAVEQRLRRGHWLRGVHARRPDGSKALWVNLTAVGDWAAGKVPAHLHGTGSAK